MLISLVAPLISPPVPFTVKVSADVMPVLPTSSPLPLVLLLVSVPPIVTLRSAAAEDDIGAVEAHNGRWR